MTTIRIDHTKLWTVLTWDGTRNEDGKKVWIAHDYADVQEAAAARDRLRAEGFTAHIAQLAEVTP